MQEMFTYERQVELLNALSNDLSLLKYTKNSSFPLSVKDFEENNQKWFALLLQAREIGYDRINEETVKILLPNLNIFINDIKDPKTDVLNIMEQWINFKTSQQFHQTVYEINRLAQMANNMMNRNQYNEIIKRMNELVGKLKKISSGWNSRSVMEVLTEDFQYEEDAGRIPTYLSELDEVLGGGFYRAGIHVISAFPHNGKTTSAVQFATMQACHDFKVLYLSLEQNAIDILENVLSVLAEDKKFNRSYWEVGKLESAEAAREKREQAKVLIKEQV